MCKDHIAAEALHHLALTTTKTGFQTARVMIPICTGAEDGKGFWIFILSWTKLG